MNDMTKRRAVRKARRILARAVERVAELVDGLAAVVNTPYGPRRQPVRVHARGAVRGRR